MNVNSVIQWVPGKGQVIPDALSRGSDYGKCSSLVVEPNFLGNVSKYTFDPHDVEMAGLIALAQLVNSNLHIVKWLGIDLLLSITTSNELLLVIPNAMGLKQLLLEELHCTPPNSHPVVRKIVDLLYLRVWWPSLRNTVILFISSCNMCQRVKDRITLTPGLLEPLPVPKTKFSYLSLNFITDLLPNQGSNGLLVVVDRLTKYTTLILYFIGPDAPVTLKLVALLLF